tara:strand:- start:705 stop:869 length:165 start_codon:yes stop_codon:yes gene_type:complete
MPTQNNYNHIKNELSQAKLKIIELEKQIEEYKKLKKVSFNEDIKLELKEVKKEL